MAVLIGAALVYHTSLGIDDELAAQRQRNSYLEGETKKLEEVAKTKQALEAKKQNLLSRMSVIEELQHSRTGTVRLFNEIPILLPDGVYLRQIIQLQDRLEITGQAGSNSDVSDYMRRLSNSENVTNPKLLSINTDDVDHTVDFKLRVEIKKKDEKKT